MSVFDRTDRALAGETIPASGRILLVDDHFGSSNALARLLQRRGYQIETASDGINALRSASDFRPDVILLDVELPDMDGREVAALLRHDPAHQHCLLIAITGFDQDQATGFDHHLVKPINLEDLQGLISDFLSRRAASDARL